MWLSKINFAKTLKFNPDAKNITFHWNLRRNLQSAQGCQISPRLHNGTCNTAFESLGVIVLNVIIFGYHNGTQNTQNSENVRYLKWGRLESGHLELCGIIISQQVLTTTIIIKNRHTRTCGGLLEKYSENYRIDTLGLRAIVGCLRSDTPWSNIIIFSNPNHHVFGIFW